MTRTSAMYMKTKMTDVTRILIFFNPCFSIMCDLYNCVNLDDWMTGMNALTRVTTITMMTRMITQVG